MMTGILIGVVLIAAVLFGTILAVLGSIIKACIEGNEIVDEEERDA